MIVNQFNNLQEAEQRQIIEPILVYILETTQFTKQNPIAIFTKAAKILSS